MAGRPYDSRSSATRKPSPSRRPRRCSMSTRADYAKSAASDFASIPVTADYHYSTTSAPGRVPAVRPQLRRRARREVIAIWYFTPQSTADGKPVWDVPTMSPHARRQGRRPRLRSALHRINATGVTQAPYTRSTEPFEMVKNTMYFVGDNEVASYLLKADMGTADPSDDKVIKVDGVGPTAATSTGRTWSCSASIRARSPTSG